LVNELGGSGSVRDVSTALRVTHGTARYYLNDMARGGWVTKERASGRSTTYTALPGILERTWP